ncbi:MAG TPA: VCBS repeat-containing protein, partial [candidate division Zixibacteria bacterium]|nr:VCBS repeat-containing protein [candidate division Zixibacteria bacterium]
DSVWKFDFRAEYLAVAGAELRLFAIDAEATLNGFAPGALTVASNPGIEPYGVCVAGGIVTTLNENVNQQRFELRNSAGAVYSLTGVFSSGPVGADLDRDGRTEYVVCEADGRIVIVSEGSGGPSSFEYFASAGTGHMFTGDPVISDVDRDGYPDVLIPGAGVMHGFNQQLSNLVGFPWPIDRDFSAAAPTGPALVADVSLDNEPDVIVAVEALDSLAGSVYALGNGVQFGFPLPGGGAPQGAPVIVDNNGPQTIAYLGRDGFLYNWKINSAASDVQWRMVGADAGGTNFYDATGLPAPKPLSGGIDEDNFYCYPNPIVGASATVRYTLGRNAERVRLMILDLSGEIIREFSGGGAGGFANEVAIDCSDMVPGVYRVRLEARFGGDTETAFTDIAVAH